MYISFGDNLTRQTLLWFIFIINYLRNCFKTDAGKFITDRFL